MPCASVSSRNNTSDRSERLPAAANGSAARRFLRAGVLGLLFNGLLLAALIHEDRVNSLLGLVTVTVIGIVYKVRAIVRSSRSLDEPVK